MTSITRPQLLAITHDGPVKVRRLGASHNGIVLKFAPEQFGALVEFVNDNDGPSFWEIAPVGETSNR